MLNGAALPFLLVAIIDFASCVPFLPKLFAHVVLIGSGLLITSRVNMSQAF